MVCQSFVREFCALSARRGYDAAFCLPPRDVVYEMAVFGDFAVDESDIAFFLRFALEIVAISGALMSMCAQRRLRLIRDGPIGVRVREIRCRVC